MSFVNNLSAAPNPSVDILDQFNRNLVFKAIKYEHLGVIYALRNYNPAFINQVDNEKHSPLSYSILENKFKATNVLIQLGADVKIGGGPFGSNLHISIQKLNYEFSQLILEKGADCNARDKELNSPLHLLFQIFSKDIKNSLIIAESLMRFGANPNAENLE